MKAIQVFMKLSVVSAVVLFLLPACRLSTLLVSPETGVTSPTLSVSTTTPDANMGRTTPATGTVVCPPENTSFPDPEELEGHLGLQYLHNPVAFDYPDEEFGALLSIDGDKDYGIIAYALDDNSFMLVLEKFLCNDSAGFPAWEIVDAVRTTPVEQDKFVYLGSNCMKNGQLTLDYQFVLLDKNNTGNVYGAWSVSGDKKITEVSVEGLLCSFGS